MKHSKDETLYSTCAFSQYDLLICNADVEIRNTSAPIHNTQHASIHHWYQEWDLGIRDQFTEMDA